MRHISIEEMIYPSELITPTFKEGQTMTRMRQKTSITRGGGGGYSLI